MRKPEPQLRHDSAPPGRRDEACTAAALFDAMWTSLVDMLGPTATATLIERSVKRARAKQDNLEHPVIVREQFTYRHRTPPSWSGDTDLASTGFQAVVAELLPLLVELTGTVVVRRLREVPILERCGVIPRDVTL
jgi:hypothetical protein